MDAWWATLIIIIISSLAHLVLARRRRQASVTEYGGKVALVTGGAAGIGLEVCKRLVQLGINVVVWDIDQQALIGAVKQLSELDGGGSVYGMRCDVSSRHAVREGAARVRKEVGVVAILVNNAGCFARRRLWDLETTDVERSLAVNVMAHFWTCLEFVPDMIARRPERAHIVTVSSNMAYVPSVGLADYCASKAALVGFHECMRLELRRDGIDWVGSSLVCPYHVDTGLFQGAELNLQWLLPSLAPGDVAEAIVEAVLARRETVSLPWWLRVLPAVRALPAWFSDPVLEGLGGRYGMAALMRAR